MGFQFNHVRRRAQLQGEGGALQPAACGAKRAKRPRRPRGALRAGRTPRKLPRSFAPARRSAAAPRRAARSRST